jgi:hypothetical protein
MTKQKHVDVAGSVVKKWQESSRTFDALVLELLRACTRHLANRRFSRDQEGTDHDEGG